MIFKRGHASRAGLTQPLMGDPILCTERKGKAGQTTKGERKLGRFVGYLVGAPPHFNRQICVVHSARLLIKEE